MKKGLFSSYVSGIRDKQNGENLEQIFRYFLPEFITALVLYSSLYLVDAYWIADLKSTSTYATLGMTNTFLHFIVKVAEGLSVGAIVLTGIHNGQSRYQQAGRTFVDVFWTTCVSGAVFASILFFGAYWIYWLLGVPKEMIALGIPFLRIRAIGIFFMFLYFAFIGFLRGIKNTKTPMKIFIVGASVFLFFDYVLIFGKFGFPKMQLRGSAMATVLQYGVMLCAAIFCFLFDKQYRIYGIKLFSVFTEGSQLKRVLRLSWRVMIDKAIFAASYIWLGRMIAPMGNYALATFAVVKDLERFAILPAVALAQVVTLLVSNDYGPQNWHSIKSNIKKIIFLSSTMVFSGLLVLSIWPHFFVQLFDRNGDFTWLAASVLPFLSVLVFFDLLQLILAGAMRGASNVNTVMVTRLLVCVGFVIPVSYFFSWAPIQNQVLKFVLIYGSFYIGSAIMSISYIYRFRGEKWKKQKK